MNNEEAINIIQTRLNTYYCTDEDLKALDLAIKALEANVEERPKGKWIPIHKGYVCSNCNKYTIHINDKHYCFKCGADMRGDV